MQDMQFDDPNEFKEMIEDWNSNVSKLEAKARRIESVEVWMTLLVLANH